MVVILDLFSRKVLSWRISNSMDAVFCIEALEEAIELYGEPAIFNTDQGSQFTSDGFIDVLEDHNIEISMDGKGRALDNIYVLFSGIYNPQDSLKPTIQCMYQWFAA